MVKSASNAWFSAVCDVLEQKLTELVRNLTYRDTPSPGKDLLWTARYH